LPEELILLLMVGLFWLARFVRQQRRRQVQADTEGERGAQAAAAADEQPGPASPPAAFMSNLAEGPRWAPAPRDRHAPASTAMARATARRYSRSALMGNRRAVQNAVVTAAILQPCRAHRPHGMD
jgi:hypothetical protein